MATAMDAFTMSQLGMLRWAGVRQRVRAFASGEVVVDSTSARLVWEPHRVVGSYAVPLSDLAIAPVAPVPVAPAVGAAPILTPDDPFSLHTSAGIAWALPLAVRALVGSVFSPDDDDLAGYVLLDWQAFDEWREEEQTVVAHPHDPFQRIDCLASGRRVVVTLDGVVLADTTDAVLLLETHLPPRWYLPPADVRMDLLVPSGTHTDCAYKGHASYWSAVVDGRTTTDVAWSYPDPLHDAEPVRDLLCFYPERVMVDVDALPLGGPV